MIEHCTPDLFVFMRQPPEQPLGHAPFQAHSETSREAAKAIEPDSATLRGMVLQYLRNHLQSGATDEEMQLALDMNPSTQRPRRIELVQQGFVYDSGQTRKTTSNRRAVVWKAV